MSATPRIQGRDEDDKAKLAYALAGSLPYHDGVKLIQDLNNDCSSRDARALLAKGKRLAAQTIGRKA